MRRFFAKTRASAALLAVAAAAAGAVPALSDDSPSRTSSTTISISAPLRWWMIQRMNLVPHELAFPSLGGLSLINHSVASATPPTDFNEEVSGSKGDDSRCCPGCLGRNSIAVAAEAAASAVVNISVTQSINGMMIAKGIGSGTIIDPDGTILTCAHVVLDFLNQRSITTGKVEVTLRDGRKFDGVVVNADFHSDIAVVKITSKTPLAAAKLGLSKRLRPGDWVVALGCPLSLQNTITAGIVSSVDRKSSDLGLLGVEREYLQTDCAINQGNSGGPLVNLDGEVIGINIMKVANADGLSFAVPIDSAAKIMEQFKKNGRVVRPWLGVKLLDLTEKNITHLKEKDGSFPDVRNGVLVVVVTPGSPADQAGFSPGDIIIEFNGKLVGSIKEIIDVMGDKVGTPFTVLVKRANNKLVSLRVTPAEMKPDR
ncbi:Peptidase Do protein [Dioscorea alata]|uniref:Peptidase Do protein n=1 Tax=Dioscorea alata TaxID=55571 RepID=A0ACB7W0Z4_DIOAL|nr:Peptidase Do protein [Dioscorea alata]